MPRSHGVPKGKKAAGMARFEAGDDVPSKAEELDGITPASGTCAAGVATEAERSFASQEPRCEDVPSCEEVPYRGCAFREPLGVMGRLTPHMKAL